MKTKVMVQARLALPLLTAILINVDSTSNLAALAQPAATVLSQSEVTSLFFGSKQSDKPEDKQIDAAVVPAASSKADAQDDKKPYADEAVKHYNRAVELHQSGFLNQAIAEYKAAIDADNRIEEAYSNLGVIYTAQRNYPRAKESFLKALSLRPNRPTTLNGLGTVLYTQGNIKEAKEQWKQALLVDPNFSAAYYNLGNALESEKKPQEAIAAYAKAINISPNMADAYYRVGIMLDKEKHYAQASALLRKAIALSPDSEFVREAKHLVSGLENEFAKDEPASSEGQHSLFHAKNNKASHKNVADENKDLNMFVQLPKNNSGEGSEVSQENSASKETEVDTDKTATDK